MALHRWSMGQSKDCVWDVYHKIGAKVSAGGFGFVTRAVSLDGTRVAIKTVPKLPVSKSKRRRTAEKLQQEVEVMRRVQHEEYVVNLRETFEDKNFFYMVMELCEGGELAAYILEQGSHNEGQVALVMRQVFAAVTFLHGCNVCHRDLKPENLLLLHRRPLEKNVLKVADFGLAVMGAEQLQGVAGTLHFMAPQVLSGRYDKSVDLWSCGVIMYLLLCGYPPFWHEFDMQRTEMSIRRGNFAFKEQDWELISEGAKTLIRNLLKMQPTERISARDAQQDPWVSRHHGSTVSLSAALARLSYFVKVTCVTHSAEAPDEGSAWQGICKLAPRLAPLSSLSPARCFSSTCESSKTAMLLANLVKQAAKHLAEFMGCGVS